MSRAVTRAAQSRTRPTPRALDTPAGPRAPARDALFAKPPVAGSPDLEECHREAAAEGCSSPPLPVERAARRGPSGDRARMDRARMVR